MTESKIVREALVEGLKQLSPVLSRLTQAKRETSRLIALCELTSPTLKAKSEGNKYFDYTADALRSILDERDIELYQASQLIAVLSDRIMDLDSMIGNATQNLDNSTHLLNSAKKRGPYEND